MRVPTLVTVLGTPYNIIYKEKHKDLHGEALLESKQIIIATSSHNSKEDLIATIFHETLHAVLWESGMSSVIDDDSKEEGIIRAIENALKAQYKITGGIYSRLTTLKDIK